MTVVAPVFDAPAPGIDFFTASRAHHADVGGITPGSMPPGSRDIGEEGALIAPTRIVRDGRLDEARLRVPSAAGAGLRAISPQNLADLRAQLAANARGARELQRAADEHGRRHAARLHAPRAGQRRTRACAARSAGCATAASATRLDDGQAIEVPHRRRPRGRHGDRRLHRHVGAAATTTSMRRARSRSRRCSTCSAR